MQFCNKWEAYAIQNDIKSMFHKIGEIVDGMDEQTPKKELSPSITLSEYDKSERSHYRVTP